MNVSSVKNLNGEVFSAVQDASLTNVVQTNSGNWQDITAYQNNSASYQPSGNYIPYTAVDISNTAFKTNSGLSIDRFGEGGLYSTLLSPNTIQMFFVASPTSYYGSILADTSLKFETQSDSAYVDKEKIHTWDSASNYIQNISANWDDVSTTVQTNSAQWAEEVISSYTTAYSHDIPPYGGEVINSLNGKFLSAFVSKSADNAKVATNANTATYAQTVDETKLENDGFVKNLSSDYGTISVVRNTIESTNSAIARTGNEGFVSSFGNQGIGPTLTANFSWDKSLPNTKFNFTESYAQINTKIYYSANTNLTGELTVTAREELSFSVEVPNATALDIWSNDWIQIHNNVASAADSFETVFGELAWASALPTYEYDSTNKISAINGSAIAAGDEFPVSADEAIQYVQTNSAGIDDTITNVTTNSGAWGGSALPISAGPGIKVNLVDNTLVFGSDYNETVLWEGTPTSTVTSIQLSEPWSGFERIKLFGESEGGTLYNEIDTSTVNTARSFNLSNKSSNSFTTLHK